MKMIEKVNKKTFVKNVEHTKFCPTNSSLPSILELRIGFHLQMLPATTGDQVRAS
jgi:hypothetical protein